MPIKFIEVLTYNTLVLTKCSTNSIHMLYHIALAAWLFLDETLKKSSEANKNDNSDNNSIATDCETDSVVTVETDLTNDTLVTSDTMVTVNGKVVEDGVSDTTSINDVEPLLMVSHDPPAVKTNWRTKCWELLYERVYCCHGCNLRKISCKLSRRHLTSARAKLIVMGKLMMDRRVIVSVSLYGLLGFVAIITNEVMWCLLCTGSHDLINRCFPY